ncbi:MAG: protein kinase [Phycisphaerae bacterium]|nr:protein kinase [Phycisphaerae bacterium]
MAEQGSSGGTEPSFGPPTGFGDDVTVAGCPNRAQLELFAAGASDAGHVAMHLPMCPVCREIVRQLHANNALVGDYVHANRVYLDRPLSATGPSGPLDGDGDRESADVVPGFRVEGEIHRGAQGVVYRAEQLSTRRKVALKTLLQGKFATSRQRVRFEREVEVVASLRHPNIVTLFESGRTREGLAFFAMELVAGQPWSDLLKGDNKPPLAAMLRTYLATVRAIGYAHQRGVIHRDLKPANILIDAELVPHVLDFGLARNARGDETQEAIETTAAGEFLGTFAYAAPEQLKGDPDQIDVRTDVFALGVILYEILVGERPWQLQGRVSIADLLIARLEDLPRPPSALRPDLDPDLDVIVLKCLKSAALERYQTATALADDVERFIEGKPILARPDSSLYFARKWIARHRLATTLAAIAVVLSALFVVAISIATVVAVRNAARASKTLNTFLETLRSASAEHGVGSADMSLNEFLSFVEANAIKGADDDLEVTANIVNAVNQIAPYPEGDAAKQKVFHEQLETARSIALRLSEKRGEADIPEVADALHNLGRAAYNEQHFREAEEFYRQALAMHERINGRDAIRNALTMRHLAATVRQLGQSEPDPTKKRQALDEAISLFEREFAAYAKVPGKTAEMAAAQNGLANVDEARGDEWGALWHFEQSEELLAQSGAKSDDYRVARVTFSIEKLRRRLGQPGLPIDDLRVGMQTLVTRMGVGHASVAEAQCELTESILRSGGDLTAALGYASAVQQRATDAISKASNVAGDALESPVIAKARAKAWTKANEQLATATALVGRVQLRLGARESSLDSFAIAIASAMTAGETAGTRTSSGLAAELRAAIVHSLEEAGLHEDAARFRPESDGSGRTPDP